MMKGLSWKEILGAVVMAFLFWFLAVLILVSCPEQAVGAEQETQTESQAPSQAPAEVEQKEEGHWLIRLQGGQVIDLFAPLETDERVWSLVDAKGKLRAITEAEDPAIPNLRRCQIGFQYAGDDNKNYFCFIVGITDVVNGVPRRHVVMADLPLQGVEIVRVEVPGPERVVEVEVPVEVQVTKTKTRFEWWHAVVAGGVIYLIIPKKHGGGVIMVPDDRPAKYCPFMRQHDAAGDPDEAYTFRGETWDEVSLLLRNHLLNCPYAKESEGWTGDPDNPWNPQGGGPGVGDSLIASVSGTAVWGLPLDKQTRLFVSGARDLALVRKEGDVALFLASDGSYGIKARKFALELAPIDRRIAAAVKVGSFKIRWSSIEGHSNLFAAFEGGF